MHKHVLNAAQNKTRQAVETTQSGGLNLGKVPSELKFEPRSPRYGKITVLAHNEPKMGFRVGKMAQNGRKWPMVHYAPGWVSHNGARWTGGEPKLGSRGVFGPF